jgi:hypothetical protein
VLPPGIINVQYIRKLLLLQINRYGWLCRYQLVTKGGGIIKKQGAAEMIGNARMLLE